MRLKLWVVLGAVLFAAPALANEYTIYGMAERFFWDEKATPRHVREHGTFGGVGSTATFEFLNKQLALRTKAEFTGGSAKHSGVTQGGTPFDSDDDYYGYKIEVDFAPRVPLGQQTTLEPLVGLGHKWWHREVQDTDATRSDGTPIRVIGYPEIWQSDYFYAGARTSWEYRRDSRLFAEARVRVPFYNENEADVPGFGKTTLHPGKALSFAGEAGVKIQHILAAFYYEEMFFPESPVVNNLFQPDSRMDIFGIKLGVAF